MIVVCSDLEKRLDSVWYRLQRLEQERVEGSISQLDLDEACVARLEKTVDRLEGKLNYTR